MHLAIVRLKLFQRVVDSYAFLNPIRELWSQKGWHNRIRHVDPPKSNLFQQLKLTQQARAHDPGPHRRQKNVQLSANASSWPPRMRNCQRLRQAEVPECVTVSNSILLYAFGYCKIETLSASCRQLHILESNP